jgi:hypothetical protein
MLIITWEIRFKNPDFCRYGIWFGRKLVFVFNIRGIGKLNFPCTAAISSIPSNCRDSGNDDQGRDQLIK